VSIKPKSFEEILTPVFLLLLISSYSARLELTLNPGIVGTLPSELVKLIALGTSDEPVTASHCVERKVFHLTVNFSLLSSSEYIGIGRMGIYGRLPTELGLLTGLGALILDHM